MSGHPVIQKTLRNHVFEATLVALNAAMVAERRGTIRDRLPTFCAKLSGEA
jgi:hypothetical protein